MARETEFRFWDEKKKHFTDEYLISAYGVIMKESYWNNISSVNNATVCQYIGRKDINGKKIYNNFIVQCELGTKYKVVFSDEWCAFMLIENKTGRQVVIYPEMQLEAIGNIYENPELI